MDSSREPLLHAGESAPKKKSWLVRNWLPVVCLLFALAGLALALFNFIKPCDLKTTSKSSMDMMVMLDGSSSICTAASGKDNPCHVKLEQKIDFGNPGINVQSGYTKLGATDAPYNNQPWTGAVKLGTTLTVTIDGYSKIRGNKAGVEGPFVNQSNLLRSSFLCDKKCEMKVTVTGLKKNAFYRMKTWHHDSDNAGSPFVLRWSGTTPKELKEAAPKSPDPPTTHTADVRADKDGKATLELIKSNGDASPLNLNALEIYSDGLAIFEKQKTAAVKLIQYIGDKITDPEVGVIQFSGGAWLKHPSKEVQGSILYSGSDHGCTSANGQCYWSSAETAKKYCATWDECKALYCTNKNSALNGGAEVCYARNGKSLAASSTGDRSFVMAPVSDFVETFAKLSASVPDVVAKTQTMRLIEGATDFGSPLALCHNNIKNMATGTTADTKKFCVLVSDGLPNEDIVTAPMLEFCREQNISTAADGCGFKDTAHKKPQSCCTAQTIQIRLKALGYMIMAVYVKPPSTLGWMANMAVEKLRTYGSCEKRGQYGLQNVWVEDPTTREIRQEKVVPFPDLEPKFYEPALTFGQVSGNTTRFLNYDKEVKGAITPEDVGKGIAVTGDQLSIDSIGRSAKSVKESVGGVNIPWNAKVKDVELDAKGNAVFKGNVTLDNGVVFKNPQADDCLLFMDATSMDDLIAKLPKIAKALVEFTPKKATTVCVGNPLWLFFALGCFGPLLIYIFWLPISIIIAKMLLRNRGPVKGRLRRKLAKKAYDMVADVVQSGAVGDPQTQIFVQNNINDKVYTLDAHILANPKDVKSGHAATVDEMKAQLAQKSGIAPRDQRLVYKGTELVDGTKITEYDLENNCTVFLNPKPTKVRIKARMQNSTEPKVFELDVDQSYSIDAVKQAMKDEQGIPISAQQLWMNGNELLGNVALSDLPAGLELSLNPISGVFPVSLVSPNGETTPISVKATHKIGNVKKRLQKQGTLPDVDPAFVRIVFNGNEIGDKQCCMDHDIPEDAMLFVNPKRFRMPVRKPNGEIFELEVDPSYSVERVKRELQERQEREGMSSTPLDQLKIFMQGADGGDMVALPPGKTLHELGINADTPSGASGQPLLLNPIVVKDKVGKVLPISVTPTSAVEDIKAAIERASGVPAAEQTLIFEPHSIVDGLADGKPLSAYGVSPDGNAVLSLNPNRLKLNAKMPSGKTVPIDVDAAATIDDVKKKLMEGAGTLPAETQIYFNGKEIKRGDLLDYNITDGDTLLLNPVMVHPEKGKPFAVDVSFDDPVTVLKDQVRLYEIDHTEVKGSKLVYRGQTIGHIDVDLDDNKTLASYGMGIGPDRAVFLEPKPIKLAIVPPTAGYDPSAYTLTVDKSWTIDQVKQEICQKAGIAVPEQKLMVVDGAETRELEMGTTLLENGIVDSMTLYLNPNDIRCFVKLPNGKAVVTTLNTADTPSQVRRKVEKITHIGSLEDTTLKYGIEDLDEGKCLAQYDIVADSTIAMTRGGAAAGGGKKWNVDAGSYFRGGQTSAIKVDYGKSGIAPPSSKIGEKGEVSKLKAAANTVSLLDKMKQMVAEESDSDDDEEQARLQEAKERRLAAMRHAALDERGEDGGIEERAILESDPDMDTGDLSYKYTLCLMKCCPCLRPETEEEIEAKKRRVKHAETKTRPPAPMVSQSTQNLAQC